MSVEVTNETVWQIDGKVFSDLGIWVMDQMRVSTQSDLTIMFVDHDHRNHCCLHNSAPIMPDDMLPATSIIIWRSAVPCHAAYPIRRARPAYPAEGWPASPLPGEARRR